MRSVRRGVLVAVVLVVLVPTTATAQEGDFVPGGYEVAIEYQVASDDCGHEEFVGMLPTLLTLEIDADGDFVLRGPSPWVEVNGTIDADGTVTAVGIGSVAGFDGVTVTMDGIIDLLGIITGELSYGTDGELPGDCPIVWALVFLSGPEPVPETTTTTSSTTSTTTTTTTMPATSSTGAATPTNAAPTPVVAEEGGGFGLILLLGFALVVLGVVGLLVSARTTGTRCPPGTWRNCTLTGSSIAPRTSGTGWEKDLDSAMTALTIWRSAVDLVAAAAGAGAGRAGAVAAGAAAASTGDPVSRVTSDLADAVQEAWKETFRNLRRTAEGTERGYDVFLRISYDFCCESWLLGNHWTRCNDMVRFPPPDRAVASDWSVKNFPGQPDKWAWDPVYIKYDILKAYTAKMQEFAAKACKTRTGCCKGFTGIIRAQ